MNKLVKLSFFGILMIGLGQSLTSNNIVNAEENNYVLGTHLEAEDYNDNQLVEITNNPNASGGAAIDAGESGSVFYTFNMEKAGTYRLALGYYSGGNNGVIPQVSINVNGGTTTYYTLDALNGWCADTNRLPLAKSVEVELLEGKNVITYSAAGQWVNLDYIAIFNLDDPYEDNEMYNNLKADGMRIQAEWCSEVAGDYVNRNAVFKSAGTAIDGYTFCIDDDVNSRPGWIVEASEAGEYVMQVAYYSGVSDNPINKWTINGTSYNFVFPSCTANWNTNNYSSKMEFVVNLKQGENVIYYNYTQQGFVDYDWFRLYQKNIALDTKIEAEDNMYGDVNAQKSESSYAFISNYVVEIAQGNVCFDISVKETSIYSLFIAGYTDTAGAYLSCEVNGNVYNLFVTEQQKTGWLDSCTSEKLMRFDIPLLEGDNTILIKKGSDDVAFNYIDLDYLILSKGNIDNSALLLEATQKKALTDFITLDLNKVSVVSNNENVIKVENNELNAVGVGNASLTVTYTCEESTYETIVLVRVEKTTYIGEDLIAKNTTKAYTGEQCLVDVEMPEGWSFTQTGDSTAVGTYQVTITFTHPLYEDVVKTATLTITKGVYLGDELIAEDATFTYDGEEKYLIASAPFGWTIEYENNGQVEVGEYEVIVKFTHDNYDTITKTVILTIIEAPNSASPVVPIVIGSVIVLAAGAGVAFVIIKKRKQG